MRLPRGIGVHVRHAANCPRRGEGAAAQREHRNDRSPLDSRVCKCSPHVRIRLAHDAPWWWQGSLPEGWRTDVDLQPLVDEADKERAAVRSGWKVAPAPQGRAPVPSVAEWSQGRLAQWLLDIETGDADIAESSWLLYRSRITAHIAPPRSAGGIGDLLLTAVTPVAVREFKRHLMVEKGLKESTAANVITLVSRLFREALDVAKENGWPLDANPVQMQKRKAQAASSMVEPPNDDDGDDGREMPLDVARMLLRKHDGTPFGDLLWLALTTGMRQAEIAGLQHRFLQVSRRRIWVGAQLGRSITELATVKAPKSGNGRYVPIYSKLAATRLARYDGGEGLVFTDNDQRDVGGPWQVRKMAALLSASWDELVSEHTTPDGSPVFDARPKGLAWHACRHLYSNLLERGGVRDSVRKSVLGHPVGDVNSQRYINITDADRAAVDPVLDRAFGDLLPTPDIQVPERAFS